MKKLTKTKLITFNTTVLAFLTVFTFITIPSLGTHIAALILLVVVVASIFGGWKSALFASAAMGILSLIRSFVMPGVLAPLFWNPMVSVVARLFIGPAVFGTYRLLRIFTARIKNVQAQEVVSISVAGAVAAVVNTGLVFLMMWLFFDGDAMFGTRSLYAWFLFLLGANFPWEIGMCAALSAPILLALKKSFRVEFVPVNTKDDNREEEDDIAIEAAALETTDSTVK